MQYHNKKKQKHLRAFCKRSKNRPYAHWKQMQITLFWCSCTADSGRFNLQMSKLTFESLEKSNSFHLFPCRKLNTGSLIVFDTSKSLQQMFCYRKSGVRKTEVTIFTVLKKYDSKQESGNFFQKVSKNGHNYSGIQQLN